MAYVCAVCAVCVLFLVLVVNYQFQILWSYTLIL